MNIKAMKEIKEIQEIQEIQEKFTIFKIFKILHSRDSRYFIVFKKCSLCEVPDVGVMVVSTSRGLYSACTQRSDVNGRTFRSTSMVI